MSFLETSLTSGVVNSVRYNLKIIIKSFDYLKDLLGKNIANVKFD